MNKFLRYTLLSVVSMMAGIGSAQTVFNLDNDYATIFPTITGTSSSTSTAGDFTAATTSIAKDGITLTVSTSTASTANRIWSSSPRLRLYGGTLTIAAENATITAIAPKGIFFVRQQMMPVSRVTTTRIREKVLAID